MVTHCICHDVSLERLKRTAATEGLDLDGLKARTGCCTGCGMCEPYVRVMLRTGQTRVAVMTPDEAAREMKLGTSRVDTK